VRAQRAVGERCSAGGARRLRARTGLEERESKAPDNLVSNSGGRGKLSDGATRTVSHTTARMKESQGELRRNRDF